MMHRLLRIPLALALLGLLVSAAAPAAAAPAGKVNINRASAEQLELLPRVGPALAQRIVAFREANGPFQKAEDLMLVRGIGEKSFALLAPWVTVSGDTTLKEKVPTRRTAVKD